MKIRHRILSIFCAICMLIPSFGDLYVFANDLSGMIVRTKSLTASDGNTYRVTVDYDTKSGIPQDAELVVAEIKEGDAGYDEYVKKSAEKLGETAENVQFARAFDITLLNPETGEEYQPTKDVQVSIELLNGDLNNYANVDVVHIHGKTNVKVDVLDSKISGEAVKFETDGFSVYTIVSLKDANMLGDPVTGLDDIKSGIGYYISNQKYYMLNTEYESGLKVIELNKYPELASSFYFENTGENGKYYVYTYKNGKQNYLYFESNDDNETVNLKTDPNNKTVFTVSFLGNSVQISGNIDTDNNGYINLNDGNTGFIVNDDLTNNLTLTQVDSDPLGADEKERSLITENGGKFYGVQAQQVTGNPNGLKVVEVDEYAAAGYNYQTNSDNSLALWRFDAQGDGTYYVSTETNNGRRYLNINTTNVTLGSAPQRLLIIKTDDKVVISACDGDSLNKDSILSVDVGGENYLLRANGSSNVDNAAAFNPVEKFYLVESPSGMIYYEYPLYSGTGAANEETNPENNTNDLTETGHFEKWRNADGRTGYKVLSPKQSEYKSFSNNYLWTYTFDHWHDTSESDPTKGNYKPGDKIKTEPKYSITLKAVWRFERTSRPFVIEYVIQQSNPSETVYGYVISRDGKNETVFGNLPGLEGKDNSNIDTVAIDGNYQYVIPRLVADKYYAANGNVYTFDGWAVNNANNIVLNPGQTITLDEMQGGNYRYYDEYRHITLTAKWKKDNNAARLINIYNWITGNVDKVPQGLGYRFEAVRYTTLIDAFVLNRNNHAAPADAKVNVNKDNTPIVITIDAVTREYDIIGKYSDRSNTKETNEYRFMVAINGSWQRLVRPYYTDLLDIANEGGNFSNKGQGINGDRETFLNDYLKDVYKVFYNEAYTANNQLGHVFGHNGDSTNTTWNRLSSNNTTTFFENYNNNRRYLMYTPYIPANMAQNGEIHFDLPVGSDNFKKQNFYTIGISDVLKKQYTADELKGVLISGRDSGGFAIQSITPDDMWENVSFPTPNVVGFNGRTITVTVQVPKALRTNDGQVYNGLYLKGEDGKIIEGTFNKTNYTFTFNVNNLGQPYEVMIDEMHNVSVYPKDTGSVSIKSASYINAVQNIIPKIDGQTVTARSGRGLIVKINTTGNLDAKDVVCVKVENGMPLVNTEIAYSAADGGFRIPDNKFNSDYYIITRDTFSDMRSYLLRFDMELPEGVSMSQVFGKMPEIVGLSGYVTSISGAELYTLPDMKKTNNSGSSYFTTLLGDKYVFDGSWITEWGDTIKVGESVDLVSQYEYSNDGEIVLKPVWKKDANDPLGLNGKKFVLVNKVKYSAVETYVSMSTIVKYSKNDNPPYSGLDKVYLTRVGDMFKTVNNNDLPTVWEFEAVNVDGEPYYKIFTYTGDGKKKYLYFNPAGKFNDGGDTILVDYAANLKVEHAPLEVKGLFPYFIHLDDKDKTYLDYFKDNNEIFGGWSFDGPGEPNDVQLEGDALIKELERIYDNNVDDGVTGFLNGNRWLILGEPLYELPIHVAQEKVSADGKVTYEPIVIKNGSGNVLVSGDDVLANNAHKLDITLDASVITKDFLYKQIINRQYRDAVMEMLATTVGNSNIPFVAIAGDVENWTEGASVDLNRSMQATYIKMDVGGMRYGENAEGGTLVTSDVVGNLLNGETAKRKYSNGLALYIVCKQPDTMVLDVKKEWVSDATGAELTVNPADAKATVELHRITNGDKTTDVIVDTIKFPYSGKWVKSYPLPIEDVNGNRYSYYAVEKDYDVDEKQYKKITDLTKPSTYSIYYGDKIAVNADNPIAAKKDENYTLVISNRVEKFVDFTIEKVWNIDNNINDELLNQLGCTDFKNTNNLEVQVTIYQVSKEGEAVEIDFPDYQSDAESLKAALIQDGYKVDPYSQVTLNKNNDWKREFTVNSSYSYYVVEESVYRINNTSISWPLSYFEIEYEYAGSDDITVKLTNTFDPIARVSLDGGTSWRYFSFLTNDAGRGAFDFANVQTDDSIESIQIELMHGNHNRYNLTKSFAFENVKPVTVSKYAEVAGDTSEIKRDYYRNNPTDALLQVINGADVTLNNITLTSARPVTIGCLAYVDGGTLTLTGNTLLTGGSATNGGSIYVNSGTLSMEGDASIQNSTATRKGSAIYINSGTLNIGGNAKITENKVNNSCGAIDTGANVVINFSEAAYVYNNKDSLGQQKNVVLDYDSGEIINSNGLSDGARIGVYVTNKSVNSVILLNKRGRSDQVFGKFTDSTYLQLFINDRNEDLVGMSHADDPTNIYWSSASVSRKVILRKVTDSYDSLKDAVFTIYRGDMVNPYVVDGKPLENLTSTGSGVFWIGMLPYGTYYMYEKTVPNGVEKNKNDANGGWWYELTVNETGVFCSKQKKSR